MFGTLAGVTFGVGLFVALTAAGDGFLAAARQPLAGVGADILIARPDLQADAAGQTTRGIRQPFGLASLTSDEAGGIRRMPGVADVSAGLLLWDFSANGYQTVLGVDTSQEAVGPAGVEGTLVEGRFFEADETGVVVVDRHYAAFFGLRPGDTVEMGRRPFSIAGIVEASGANQATAANLYLPLPVAQSLAGMATDEVNQIYVTVREAADIDAIVTETQAQLGEISVTTEQSIVQVMGGIVQVSDRYAQVGAIVALLSGVLLSAITFNAAISLRAREIGVMKATGWRSRDVTRLFATEGSALGVVGAVLGILVGWLGIVLLQQIPIDLPMVAGPVPELSTVATARPGTIPARLSSATVLIASMVAILGGGVTSLVAARRVSLMKPANTLRS
jgi:ABC-type antimicrobial peptide transport system permease subunit